MSPAIDVSPDFLGMFKQQVSPVSSAVATDLEKLCSTLDLLQASGQADLNALAGCLARLSDWLKNQQEAAPGDISGWTSEPFGVKGMGGMITCRSDQREVIFSQDGSGRPYLGLWHSRVPGETNRYGSFKIQTSANGTQLMLEGNRPLQVSLPGFEPTAWGTMDNFYLGLNSHRPPDSIAAVSSPPTQVQELPITTSPPSVLEVEFSPDAAPTILARPARQQTASVTLPSEHSGKKPAPVKQPEMTQPDVWQCSCGNKNASQFCLKCGRENPSQAGVEKSTLVQPTVCKQCGGVLSIGAKFCRRCGAKARE